MTGILHTIQDYMKTKFASILTDEGDRQRLQQNVRKKLPPEAAIAVDTPITLAQLRDDVQKGKSNKRQMAMVSATITLRQCGIRSI
jgi:hypothetical protein